MPMSLADMGESASKHRPARSAAALVTCFFHPDYTVGFGFTPNLLTAIYAAGSRTYGNMPFTAGGDFHPALKQL